MHVSVRASETRTRHRSFVCRSRLWRCFGACVFVCFIILLALETLIDCPTSLFLVWQVRNQEHPPKSPKLLERGLKAYIWTNNQSNAHSFFHRHPSSVSLFSLLSSHLKPNQGGTETCSTWQFASSSSITIYSGGNWEPTPELGIKKKHLTLNKWNKLAWYSFLLPSPFWALGNIIPECDDVRFYGQPKVCLRRINRYMDIRNKNKPTLRQISRDDHKLQDAVRCHRSYSSSPFLSLPAQLAKSWRETLTKLGMF